MKNYKAIKFAKEETFFDEIIAGTMLVLFIAGLVWVDNALHADDREYRRTRTEILRAQQVYSGVRRRRAK